MNSPHGNVMPATCAGSKKFLSFVISALLFSAPLFSQSNPITVENALTGSPASEWDISGYGDASIQGFANPFSINTGETVSFYVDVDPVATYSINIYRLGYYGGLGARRVAEVGNTLALHQLNDFVATRVMKKMTVLMHQCKLLRG